MVMPPPSAGPFPTEPGPYWTSSIPNLVFCGNSDTGTAVFDRPLLTGYTILQIPSFPWMVRPIV